MMDLASEVALTTERLVMPRLCRDHAADLFPILNDWEVARMLASLPWPLTRADVETYAQRQGSPAAESEDFAIVLNGTPIGVGAVKRPGSGDPPRRTPRLGYWIGRTYWRQGFASEAVAALTDYAFRRFEADIVGAGVFTDNPASRRVLEKLGFERVAGYPMHCPARQDAVMVDNMELRRATRGAAR